MVHLGIDENMGSQVNNDVSDNSDGTNRGGEERTPKVQYTIPGVLHYVQHEWAKFEMERSQWEVERAELQARIAFLQGERKGQENLKNDLVRRIKMLEYALKQERLKNHRLVHGAAADIDATDSCMADDTSSLLQQIPSEADSITSQPNSNMCWREGRQLLRKYLQEIGYTDTILDVRSYRVRSLLGLGPEQTEVNGNGTSSASAVTGATGLEQVDAKVLTNVITREHPVLSATIFGGASGSNIKTAATTGGKSTPKSLIDRDTDEDDVTVCKSSKAGAKDTTNYGLEEEEALAEFQFLSGDEISEQQNRRTTIVAAPPKTEPTSTTSANNEQSGEDWGVDYSALNRKKEMYQKEAMTKKGASQSHSRLPRADLQAMITALNDDHQNISGAAAIDSQLKKSSALGGGSGSEVGLETGAGDQYGIRMGLGDLSSLGAVDEADPNAHSVNMPITDSLRKTWSVRYTLRSHFDSVRCVAFHPVEPVLLTASEDATMKLWHLQMPAPCYEKSQPPRTPPEQQQQPTVPGANGKKPLTVAPPATLYDLEPGCTFRGHSGPILCMCLSPTGEFAYTGSLDGTVRCWTLPSPNIDPYEPYDPRLLTDTLRGHQDAVWSIAFHSSDNRLISASSDGTLKLWEPGATHPLISTFAAEANDGAPTSVDFVSTDPQQAVAAFTSSNAYIYDLEVGKPILSFENDYGLAGQINQILSHPTLPITITAHEDKVIRFFDNNTGKIIDTMVAHMDAVTCLSIDPNGLYLLSGSHDGSLRLWNVDSKTCLQEITSHRRKFDESVLAVAFHPSRPFIASGGADGLAKVFV